MGGKSLGCWVTVPEYRKYFTESTVSMGNFIYKQIGIMQAILSYRSLNHSHPYPILEWDQRKLIPFWIKYRPCPHRKDSLVEVFLYAKSPALDWKLTFYLKDKIRYFLCNTYLPSTGCLISWPIFAGHYFLKNILWREIQYCLNIIQNINWILKNILFSEYSYQEAVE